MINRISTNSLNSDYNSKNQPQFKGLSDFALGLIQSCEKHPMINVAVLDLATAIVPRTYVEGETNPYAGFEAFRRESSGLIINCLIPGIIVAGIAKLLQKPIMGAGTKMGSCLANEDTINLITEYWKDAKGESLREKVADTIRRILKDTKGVDGHKIVDFGAEGTDFEKSIQTFTDRVFNDKITKDEIQEAYTAIIKQTHASECIKIGESEKYFSQNLESVLKNATGIFKELINESGKSTTVEQFTKKAVRLLNTKSLLGLGVVIPLAISAQPINRWITAKTSGKKGAPIYKDFTETKTKELSPEQKSALFKQKIISVGAMLGTAFLSMGCKLPKMGVLQFCKIFPTMDQARLVSTATFASRMMSSEDENDLREATVRDIATFSSFYFLGDYVSKGIATLIEKIKPEYSLINHKKELKGNANIFERLWHWTKDTALKSSDEVVGKAVKMRSVCQLGNILFSLAALGIIIPKFYRGKTDREHEKELKK